MSIKKNPNIGFSSFANLRPRNCILAGAAGTHSVCVCIYHQNVKLQFSSLSIKGVQYRSLLDNSVCDITDRNCMLQICKYCPKEKGVKDFLMSFEAVTDREYDNIKYKQWVSTDRCNLIEHVEPFEQFIDSLCKNVVKLTRHHFIAKKQSEFLKSLKENVSSDNLINLCDFSENYSFVIQDEAQGFHWVNSQCTVHPFVVYFKDPVTNETKHESFCFLSPNLQHNTIMVYTFLTTLILYVKECHPNIKKIHYFTDGSSAQYKNRYNFSNICKHKQDFELDCEWHFFATSHGKSSCDGIGGTIKRSVAKASLQRIYKNLILTSEFFYTTNKEIEASKRKLNERFSVSLQIPGTRKFHKFVPVNEIKIKALEISFDENGIERSTQKTNDCIPLNPIVEPHNGDYIVCKYNETNWVGFVELCDEEFNDFGISFLYPSGSSRYYYFPEKKTFVMLIWHIF